MSQIHLARHQQILGSFSEAEVREGIASQRFLRDDLSWRAGMSEWRPLHEMTALWETETVAASSDKEIDGSSLGTLWERRSQVGFFKALFQTTTAVLLHPGRFFSTLPATGKIKTPLFYYLIMGAMSVFMAILQRSFSLVLQLLPSLSLAQLRTTSYKEIMMSLLLFLGVLLLVFVIVVALLSLFMFLWSLLQHVSLKIIGGSKESWKTTFRAMCYVGGAAGLMKGLFSLGASLPIVPIVGIVIVGVWSIFLTFTALKKVHHISRVRLVLAMVIPILLITLPGFLLMKQALQIGYPPNTSAKTEAVVPSSKEEVQEEPKEEVKEEAAPISEDTHKDADTTYSKLLEDTFYGQWEQPADLSPEEKKALSATLELTVEPDGTVSHYALVKPSGQAAMDASITAAAEKIKTVAAPPAGTEHYTTTINVTFKEPGEGVKAPSV